MVPPARAVTVEQTANNTHFHSHKAHSLIRSKKKKKNQWSELEANMNIKDHSNFCLSEISTSLRNWNGECRPVRNQSSFSLITVSRWVYTGSVSALDPAISFFSSIWSSVPIRPSATLSTRLLTETRQCYLLTAPPSPKRKPEWSSGVPSSDVEGTGLLVRPFGTKIFEKKMLSKLSTKRYRKE